jgi:tape measure domain-containing protein
MADPKIKYDIQAQVTGSDAVRSLAEGLDGLDDALSPLVAQRARELQGELAKLAQQQGLIDRWRDQKQAVDAAGAAMEAARAEATRLGREMAQIEAPTARQVKAFNAARTAAREADAAFTGQRLRLQELRAAMSGAGISTDYLVGAQLRLRQQQAGLQQQVQETVGWAQRLANENRRAAQGSEDLGAASRRGAAGLREQGQAAQQSAGQLTQVAQAVRQVASVGFAGILGGQTAQMLGDVAATADAFANLQARVRLVTGEGQAFADAWDGVSQVALRTNSSLEGTATLFTRVAQAGKELGLSQQQSLEITESINRAVQLSGSSAQASDAAITQLVQGLQSGVLRGEEFNSVMEQAPRLAQALAAGLGVTTGELRKMAGEGRLTTEVVIGALKSQRATLEKEFGSLPATIGRSLENLSTKWTLFVGQLNSSTGATGAVAQGINALADNLDELAGIATRAGAVLVAALAVQAVGALKALAVQMAATGGAAALLGRQLSSIPTAVNIVVAAVGFEVGFQIGEMLRENSALARQLGVGVTEFFVGLVNDLQFVAESAKAVFTDDTVGQAFDRYKARAEEQRAIFQGLYDDAEKSPEVVRAAAAQAAKEAENLGATVGEAGKAVVSGMAGGAAAVASVGQAADTAAGAIGGLAAAAVAKLPAVGAQAEAQAAALRKVIDAGQGATDVFAKGLPEAIAKLSGSELLQFRDSMARTLEEVERGARRSAEALQAAGVSGAAELARADRAAAVLRVTLDAVGRQAAQSLGVDVAAASRVVTKEFAAAQDNLSVLVRALPALASAGVDTGEVLREALGNMLDGAKNAAEINAVIGRLDALGIKGQEAGDLLAKGLDKQLEAAKTEGALTKLRDVLQGLGQQGRIAGDQMTEGLEKVRKKIDEIKPGINSVQEAAGKLGVKLKGELQQAADEAKRSWELIRQSTQVGLDQKVAAFAAYSKAAIAANGGVESSEIALQRTTLETQARVAGMGQAFDSAMGKASAAVDRTRAKVAQLGEEFNAAGERINQGASGIGTNKVPSLGERNASVKSTIKSDFSIDQKSGVIGSTYTPPPDNSGDYEWKSDNARPGGYWELSAAGSARRDAERKQQQEVIRQAYQRAGVAVPGGAAGMPTVGIPDAVRQYLKKDSVSGQWALREIAAPAPAAAPAAGARTITLKLGDSSAAVAVASDADADRLEAFLLELQTALARGIRP